MTIAIQTIVRAIAVVTTPSEPAVDSVILDFDDRHRRRLMLTGVGGTAFLLDLAETPSLADGDHLALDDGRQVKVVAKPEKLAEFRIEDASHLARVAWHFGNRHTPVEIRAGALRIRDDYVLVELAKKLGVDAIGFVRAPFNPERGAYGHGATMPHDHAPRPVAKPRVNKAHDHGHDHAHDHHAHDHHDHDHAHPAPKAAHAHEHGPDCGCGHDHHPHP
jgi:urease accessory protein